MYTNRTPTDLHLIDFFCRVVDVPETRMTGWNVSPENLYFIPDHWKTFPEPEKSLHLLLGMIYVFLTAAAIIGNGLVLWIFST